MANELLTEGTVWLFKDPLYNRRTNKPSESVRTIVFDRPCVILSIRRDVATVIPMTSHDSLRHEKYPFKLEETIISYAIISQITTVSISSLSFCIAKLKPKVFEDIKKNVHSFIESGTDVKRNIPWNHLALDVIRFYSFCVYEDPKHNMFMVVRDLNYTNYMIPVEPVRVSPKHSHPLYTFVGELLVDKAKVLPADYYDKNIIELGCECRNTTVISIMLAMDKILGIKIRDMANARIPMYKVTGALYSQFGFVAYKQGLVLTRYICTNPELQAQVMEDPLQVYSNIPSSLQNILYYILTHVNPLNCSIKCLDTLRKMDSSKLDFLLQPYIGAVHTTAQRNETGRMFDGSKLPDDLYRIENMKWIYRYVTLKRLSPKYGRHKKKAAV